MNRSANRTDPTDPTDRSDQRRLMESAFTFKESRMGTMNHGNDRSA